MAPAFERLVRFRAADGEIYYGEAGSEWQSDLKGREVPLFSGSDPFDSSFQLSDKKATIAEVRTTPDMCDFEHTTDDFPGPITLGKSANYAWNWAELPETR